MKPFLVFSACQLEVHSLEVSRAVLLQHGSFLCNCLRAGTGHRPEVAGRVTAKNPVVAKIPNGK